MSIKNIIRAWKDEDYRLSLSEAERALLPKHPAGLIELSGAEMEGVAGGLAACSCHCCCCTCVVKA
jgi:mersacidin/lichenicidin family type 2 lantibiotic